jgi:hypothetical protein
VPATIDSCGMCPYSIAYMMVSAAGALLCMAMKGHMGGYRYASAIFCFGCGSTLGTTGCVHGEVKCDVAFYGVRGTLLALQSSTGGKVRCQQHIGLL